MSECECLYCGGDLYENDYVFPAALGRTEKMIGQAISVDVGRAILTAVCDDFCRELVESRLDGP